VVERESLPQLGSAHAAASFGREREIDRERERERERERDANLRPHSLIQKICLRCYRGLLGGSAAFASLCACVERERERDRKRGERDCCSMRSVKRVGLGLHELRKLYGGKKWPGGMLTIKRYPPRSNDSSRSHMFYT